MPADSFGTRQRPMQCLQVSGTTADQDAFGCYLWGAQYRVGLVRLKRIKTPVEAELEMADARNVPRIYTGSSLGTADLTRLGWAVMPQGLASTGFVRVGIDPFIYKGTRCTRAWALLFSDINYVRKVSSSSRSDSLIWDINCRKSS
jgi:hypothetical protein